MNYFLLRHELSTEDDGEPTFGMHRFLLAGGDFLNRQHDNLVAVIGASWVRTRKLRRPKGQEKTITSRRNVA